jgi:hypothetical protein
LQAPFNSAGKAAFRKRGFRRKDNVNWVSKDQIKVKETDYSKGKIKLSANYVFKRKEYYPSKSSNSFVNCFAVASTSTLKPSPNSTLAGSISSNAIFAPVACLTYSQKIFKGNK